MPLASVSSPHGVNAPWERRELARGGTAVRVAFSTYIERGIRLAGEQNKVKIERANKRRNGFLPRHLCAVEAPQVATWLM